MRIQEKHHKAILDKYGAQHLGYYVALQMDGPAPLAKMATRCKLGTRVCAQIEQDLEALGLIKVKGHGLHRIIVEIAGATKRSPGDVQELLDHFAQATGCDPTVRAWIARHESAAREVIKDYGLDACKWMVDYIVSVKKIDMYSLRLIHSLAGELLPKYHQQKERRELIQKVAPITWREPTHEEKIRDSIAPEEMDGLLDFGIRL